jgi:hypothetical protein
MKKAKIAFWLIIFGFIALLTYQNWVFFMSKHSLRVDLIVVSYQTPEIPNTILFLIFFFTGLLIAYFFSLFARFKSKRTIKSMTASLEMNQQMIEELKKRIQMFEGRPPSDSAPGTDHTGNEEKDTHVP